MSSLPTVHNPPAAPGMLSLVLGVIGLLLFFLPILGIPISVFGLLFGLIGVLAAVRPGGMRLRWSLLGCAASALALAINFGIAYAPSGYLPPPAVPQPWQPIPGRPTIPPPAAGEING
ncbi:MAG TPA: hypothetical protein VKU02_12790 [Gemmataceae bacterium]|nr:hypothetical protein [Gemmataceae bacterium]